jgi:hypothetical protein
MLVLRIGGTTLSCGGGRASGSVGGGGASVVTDADEEAVEKAEKESRRLRYLTCISPAASKSTNMVPAVVGRPSCCEAMWASIWAMRSDMAPGRGAREERSDDQEDIFARGIDGDLVDE